jgi:4-aminobutyrate--pyruvate transaminase
VTIASASLTALPVNNRDFDLPLDRFLHVTCPQAYHQALPGEDDRAFVERLGAELEALIEREGADTIAALFTEPVMGAGGVIVPPIGYLAKIEEICRRHDILIIADEVICGFFRTGERWGSETYHFRPDLLTCAKALSAGFLPISALLVSDAVYQVVADNSAKIGSFGHGYTYSGHPVSAAVALEALALYEERDIKGQVVRTAPVMQAHLQSFADHPLVGEVRGVGLIGALELVEDKATRQNFAPSRTIAAKVVEAMQRRGVIGRAMFNDSLAFSPPLIISEGELGEVFGAVRESLDEVLSAL